MEYLSPSRIHLFNSCPLCFKFKYMDAIEKEDQTTDYYADYGSLVHEILEDVGNKKILLLDKAFTKFDENFSNCKLPEKIRSDYYKQGKIAIEHRFNDLQKLNIVGIEKEFKLPIDFSIPPLHGFIDLIYRDEKGRLIIRDYKTSKVYGKTEMDKQFQPYVYVFACHKLFGELPFAFEFDFVRFLEVKRIIVTETFYKMALIKVKAAWNRIKSSNFNGVYNPWFCGNFCEFRSFCPLYLKKNGY